MITFCLVPRPPVTEPVRVTLRNQWRKSQGDLLSHLLCSTRITYQRRQSKARNGLRSLLWCHCHHLIPNQRPQASFPNPKRTFTQALRDAQGLFLLTPTHKQVHSESPFHTPTQARGDCGSLAGFSGHSSHLTPVRSHGKDAGTAGPRVPGAACRCGGDKHHHPTWTDVPPCSGPSITSARTPQVGRACPRCRLPLGDPSSPSASPARWERRPAALTLAAREE